MAQSLRVAVVGCGHFSQFHFDAWARIPEVDLVGIAEPNGSKAQPIADRYRTAIVTDDLGDLIERTKPDLLDVVTPPETHHAIVTAAAGRVSTIVCQKPLAPTYTEARGIVELAETRYTRLVVHENFRFQPWYEEARRLLAAGRLGRPLSITFRLRPGDGRGPEAYLDRQPYFRTMERFLIHETGIHFVDTFRALLGEVEAVTARLRRLNPAIAGEDAGLVLFEFEDGAVGTFDGNRLVDHTAADCHLTMGEMLIEGEAGTLRLDGHGRLFLRARGETETEHGYAWEDRGFGGDCVYRLTRHVIDRLAAGEAPVNTGPAYLRNVLVEEAIYRSHESGARVIMDRFRA